MKKTLIAGGVSLMVLLGACSKDPGKTDFRKQTEKFLESSDVESKAGQKFTDAKCADPPATDVGTEYACTATGADGKSYTFGVKIDKKNSFLVSTIEPTGAAGTPTATDAAGTPAATDAATTTTAA